MIFLFLHKNIYCEYSFKVPQWDASNKYPQHMFLWRNKKIYQGPVTQSVVSLTSLLRVILLTVLADSIYNILIFFAEKMWVALHCKNYSHFFSKKTQHICISLDVIFNVLLTNDVVSFVQLGPERFSWRKKKAWSGATIPKPEWLILISTFS